MSNLTTRAMLERCFSDESKGESFREKKSNIVKPLLFAYEKEIGKTLPDMDSGEMVELIFRYVRGEYKNQPYISPSYLDTIVSTLRGIMDWYCSNIDLNYNSVFSDKQTFKSGNLLLVVIDKAGRITWNHIENIISNLHNDPAINYHIEGVKYTRADYIELVMRLFYCGFRNAQEIIEVTDSDIEYKKCNLLDRQIILDDRTWELITGFHNQYMLAIPNYNSVIRHKLYSWHNSYFKFIVQSGKSESFNSKQFQEISMLISRAIKNMVGERYSTGICANSLRWLGIHDRLAKKIGETELSNIILNKSRLGDSQLNKALKDENLHQNLRTVRRHLLQFIDMV